MAGKNQKHADEQKVTVALERLQRDTQGALSLTMALADSMDDCERDDGSISAESVRFLLGSIEHALAFALKRSGLDASKPTTSTGATAAH